MAAGVIATFMLFYNLDALIDRFDARDVQSSPVALVVYLFGFQAFYRLLATFKGEGRRKFAFFSGLASLGCLLFALVIFYIFPDIGFDVEPDLFFGMPKSFFTYSFLYICLSNLTFAVFGNQNHW